MRTILAIERKGQATLAKLADAPNDVPGLGENDDIDVSPLPAGNAMHRGEALLTRLSAHPPIKAGLDQLLSLAPGAAPAPLYFHLLAEQADELPWELLWAQQTGFCVLDERWPVGRIARRRRDVVNHEFSPPLRLLAVLSAAGRTAATQFQSLVDATSNAGFEIRLHVMSGEETVLDAAAAAGPAVTVEPLTRRDDLLRAIADVEPHVVHLLGHGGRAAGQATLAFATIGDFDAGETVGSVRVQVSSLASELVGVNPWLVVLNACDSAEAVEGRALAHELVSHGVPAVIGMRREVDLADADAFCAALYPEVLSTIRRAVDPAGPRGVRTIDWAVTLTAPRNALTGPDPAAVDTWSDPVLYVQYDPFRIDPPGLAMLRGKIDVIKKQLEQTPDLPPEFRAELEALLAVLRDQLPDDDA